MIEIDFNKQTFTCPYCGRQQVFSYGNMVYNDSFFRWDYVEKQNNPIGDISEYIIFVAPMTPVKK